MNDESPWARPVPVEHTLISTQDQLASYQRFHHAALSKLGEFGWVAFGTNVDVEGTNGFPFSLEFSTQVDDVGHPYFERVVTAQERSRAVDQYDTQVIRIPHASDPVNHPSHYSKVPGVEAIDVTRHFNFNRGNAIKYVWRAGAKGDEVEDLKKAVWYLTDEIKRLQGGAE